MCNQDYPLPNSNLVLKKGTEIIISLLGMHRDAEYFPDPLSYQPERFTEEHKNYNPIAYMPFGVGPRQCIGKQRITPRYPVIFIYCVTICSG